MNGNQSSNGLRVRIAVGFIIVAGLLAVIVIALATHTGLVKANSTDLSNAEGAFPQMVGSRIDTCALCHTASIPGLNVFGAAYKAAGRNPAALTAIQALDSDADGFTNIQEINALTFPGDPNDHPASATATSTQPPAPTDTQPAPTSTQVAPTSTQPAGGPTATRTNIPIMTLTPGPGKMTKTPRSTEIEPTEGEGHGTPEATEQEGDHEGKKTPDPTGEIHMTRTPRATDEVHQTRTAKPTDQVRPTRTQGPTQVCDTPTPGGNNPGGNSGQGDGGSRCGGGGHHKDGGGSNHRGSDFLGNFWASLTTYFTHLHI